MTIRDLNILKRDIQKLISSNNQHSAYIKLLELLDREPSFQHISFVAKKLERLDQLNFDEARVAIISNFTFRPIINPLKCELARANLSCKSYLREYEAARLEIYDSQSSLYSFSPQILFLIYTVGQFSASLADPIKYIELDETTIRLELKKVIEEIRKDLATLRNYLRCPIIIFNFPLPRYPVKGIADVANPLNLAETLHHLNRDLTGLSLDFSEVYVLDYATLVNTDERVMFQQSLEPNGWGFDLSVNELKYIANEMCRYLLPLLGKSRKVLVIDADNTLWRGIASEDGLENIKPNIEFQQTLLLLQKRGVILSLNSRNVEGQLKAVFEELETNKSMPLHFDSFGAYRINHRPKSQNCKEIAEEIGVGRDSLIFVDDDERECAEVRNQSPEIRVICLPSDPKQQAKTILNLPYFESLTLTEEAVRRPEMYHEQRKRNRDRSEYSYEDWLASLQLQLTLWEAKERDYDRIVELSLRTHQFNVANTRLSKNTVHKLVEPDHRKIIVGSCGDRFGDFGRVVFVIVAAEEDAFWNIEGFCLSCRVMNRGIETACLAYIARKVREAGTKELRGIVYPTPKNVPGQALYRDHGFEEFSSQNNEIETWKLNLTKNQLQVPNWVELKVSR